MPAHAQEMIMNGDEENDIQTVKRFGCGSVLIDRDEKDRDYEQDYKITTLQEVEKRDENRKIEIRLFLLFSMISRKYNRTLSLLD